MRRQQPPSRPINNLQLSTFFFASSHLTDLHAYLHFKAFPTTDQLSQMYKGKCWQLHVVVGYSCENDFDRLRSCEDDCLIIFYSERNFQFPVSLNPIFNSSVTSLIKNWTENHSEQFHSKNLWLGPMLTGRRSEQDWSELRSSNPTFDARDDGPLTHWRTPCVSIWTHDCANIFHNFSI